MTAAAATAPAVTERAEAIDVYRDDGPVGRAIGRSLGRAVRVPALALLAVGIVPMLAVIAVRGDGVSTLAVGIVLAWLVLFGGLSRGRPQSGRLGWALPPAVRLGEYTALLWVGAVAGSSTLPATFALLAAVAFRNYDLVYRLRHRGVTPAPWVNALSGGWDGRVIGAFVLLAASALPAGYFIAAGIFAVANACESVVGWAGVGRVQRPLEYEDEEDEGQ